MFKVAIIGPESTGKSTLTELLANHYRATHVKEYARTYLDTYGVNYDYNALYNIAKGQIQEEDHAIANDTSGLLLFDTNLCVMKIWCEVVFSRCYPFILDEIARREYDLYLLMNVDIPWVKDHMREYPDENMRKKLFLMYKDFLITQHVPWCIISGNYEERLKESICYIDQYLRNAEKKQGF